MSNIYKRVSCVIVNKINPVAGMEKCISFLQSYLLFLWFDSFMFTFITTRSCVNGFYAAEGVISLCNLVHKSFINTFVRLLQSFPVWMFWLCKKS